MKQFECLGATLDKVQFKRLCEACDYDEDVLEDFDKDIQNITEELLETLILLELL